MEAGTWPALVQARLRVKEAEKIYKVGKVGASQYACISHMSAMLVHVLTSFH